MVCQQAFEYSKRPNVISEVVTDLQALEAVELFLGKFIAMIKAIKQLNNNKDCFAIDYCILYADEERVLVELACGASLAAVYSGLIQRLQEEGRLPKLLDPLVMIVCGGGSVNLPQLRHLQAVIRK